MARSRDSALDWIDDAASRLVDADLWRVRRVRSGQLGVEASIDGIPLVDLGSNDYLALAADPRLVAATTAAVEAHGWGSGASPLVHGRHELHAQLEESLCRFEGTEAAILFSSGFAANYGTIPAVVGEGDAVFSDERNHASIIDGCRASRAHVHVYRHRDVDHLRELLGSSRGYRRRLLVTDTVFSMDGDLAPLADLADFADAFGCMLMVDEAHATGIFGSHGRGVGEYLGVEERIDIRVGTLSKALGGLGGFVAGSQRLIDWLANRARSYVFSTAPPPAMAAAALAALRIIEDEPGRRVEVLASAEELRSVLQSRCWNTGRSRSQIVPILIGDAATAVRLSDALRREGFFVPAIRPPSVPAGESLLRVSVRWGTRCWERLCESLARASKGG